MKTKCTDPINCRRLAALFLAFSILGSCLSQAYACGPDFPVAVMINGIHPDLPLKFFAAGRLGIIQSGWAQSYLIVSYRYLSGLPLDQKEQSSILNLWHHRLNGMGGGYYVNNSGISDPCLEYLRLRAGILGEKIKADASRYDFHVADNTLDDAYATAVASLHKLSKEFGEKSAEVKDWLQAQDNVFGVNPSCTRGEPAPAAPDAPASLKAQREYQLAAYKFYSNDFITARDLFEGIARSASSTLKDLASYMAARSIMSEAFSDEKDTEAFKEALAYTSKLITQQPKSKYRDDLVDLHKALAYQSEALDDSMDKLQDAVLKIHSARFGNDVGDLTFFFDQYNDTQKNPEQKRRGQRNPGAPAGTANDLGDWLQIIQEPDQTWSYLGAQEQKNRALQRKEDAKYALARWRRTRSLPWLVAALSADQLLENGTKDLLAAALKLAPQNAAFLTARFYIVEAFLKSGRKDEAHKILIDILSQKDLPPGTRNLFMFQRLLVSSNVHEYMSNVVQCPVAVSTSMDVTQLPGNWYTHENSKSYYACPGAITFAAAYDLNANLPQSYWLSWTKDKTLPKQLKDRLVRAAWLRCQLEGKESGLDDALGEAYPALRKSIAAYKSAPAGAEKRFALACLIINNCGMSPYLEEGVERHGERLNDWDSFNSNFWLPFGPKDKPKPAKASSIENECWQYELPFFGSKRMKQRLDSFSKPTLRNLLSAEEKKQLDAERLSIWQNHPSRFLGEPIIAWAKSHPRDARVPEMLYRLVKLPKWSARSDTGTKFSHQAFDLLHKQYPDSSWAQKADYWY